MTSIANIQPKEQYAEIAPKFREFSRPQKESLGKVANIVATPVRNDYRDFKLLSFAQHLLAEHGVTNTGDGIHRTRSCHAQRAFQAEEIEIRLSPNVERSKASLAGVQTCGSVWSCPVCSKRIAIERGKEIKKALEWADSNKETPIMLTFTARHTRQMSLSDFKNRFKAAQRSLIQSRAYRKLRVELSISNTIKAVEVTHGMNGWHYHTHVLMFVPNALIATHAGLDMHAWEEKMSDLWLYQLSRQGLDGIPEHALDVQYHGNVREEYLSKLGLEVDKNSTNAHAELSSGANKRGKGRTIWSLLRKASEGDEHSVSLYVEFVQSMLGENWITWSHGFKELVGADDISDEIIAENGDTEPQIEFMTISDEDYAPVRKLRCYDELLEVAAKTRDKDKVRSFLDILPARLDEQKELRLDDGWRQYTEAWQRVKVCQSLYNKKQTSENGSKFERARSLLQRTINYLSYLGVTRQEIKNADLSKWQQYSRG